MNNWITINENDIKTYLAHKQLTLLTTHASLNENGNSPLAKIIKDVINSVHLKINPELLTTEDENSNENKVHPGLKIHVCSLIIEALQSRISTFELTQDQIRNAENARKFIDSLAKSKENEQKSSAIDVLSSRQHNKLKGKDLRGL